MKINNKTELQAQTNRFKLLLQQNFGFITTRQAEDLFARTLGYRRIESLIHRLPFTLNADTAIEPSEFTDVLSSKPVNLSENELAVYFPFLLDPAKESNEDVIKKLEKCYSGLYNVVNVHLEVVGDNAGYHIANFILEGDLDGARQLVGIVTGLRNSLKQKDKLDQAVRRLTLDTNSDAHLKTFFDLVQP